MNDNSKISAHLDLTSEWTARIGRRATDELFAKAFHFNPSPMIIARISDGRCVDANEAFYQLTGFAPHEIINEADVYVDSDERQSVLSELQTADRVRQREIGFKLKNGDIRQGLLSAELIELAGEAAILTVFVDITERREMQTQLVERNLELQRVNQLKDEFLSMLSHELRTPLNAILGWSNLLLTKNLDAETIRGGLDTIRRNAKLQSRLIEDLLEASHFATGEVELDLKIHKLIPIVQIALETARETAEAKNVAFKTAFAAHDINVSIDAQRFTTALVNLLSNAVKFSPENAAVALRVEKLDQRALVQISDEGSGIAAEFLPNVFEWFRQADQSTTRVHGGLGLGLAITRSIIELHNGSISVESAGAGRGATFTVVLPLAEKNRQGD